MTTAYPLQWPDGWPRTHADDQEEGKYRFRRAGLTNPFWTFADARDALLDELARLGAENPVISSNFKSDRYGWPVEGSRRPPDQGIAVYFTLNGEQLAMARDRFRRAEENMRSLALAIEAMRALERHGGDLMMRRAFAGFSALPPPKSCWEILGIKPGSSRDTIDYAWRTKARTAHPDVGGSTAAMAELNRARDEALAQGG